MEDIFGREIKTGDKPALRPDANAKYYADMSINIYYSIMSVYGWFQWKKILLIIIKFV